MSDVNQESGWDLSKKDAIAAGGFFAVTAGGLYYSAVNLKQLNMRLEGERLEGRIARLENDSATVAKNPLSLEATHIMKNRKADHKGNFKTEIQQRKHDLRELADQTPMGELGVFVPTTCLLIGLTTATAVLAFRKNFNATMSARKKTYSLDA
jgi:hypothetical protein